MAVKTNFKNTMLFLFTLTKTNILSALSLRIVFITQSFFMLFNNIMTLIIWYFIFQKFQTIHGWNIHDMACMFGIMTSVVSVILFFMQGLIYFPATVSKGELDTFLLHPKNVIIHLACSKSAPHGFGEFITALIVLSFSGYVTWMNLPLLILSIICGIIVTFSFLLTFGSLSFWFPRIEEIFHNLWIFFVIFGTQPASIYYGILKILIFSIIPVGLISFVPVKLLRNLLDHIGSLGLPQKQGHIKKRIILALLNSNCQN